MGIKYVCDTCGKEFLASKGEAILLGQTPSTSGWVLISINSTRLSRPMTFIVCSQVCAEKALDEAKELLRPVFEKS